MKAKQTFAAMLLCLLPSLPLQAQSKYFEKQISWLEGVHDAWGMTWISNDEFVLAGNYLNLGEAHWHLYTLALNKFGQQTNFNTYEYLVTEQITKRLMQYDGQLHIPGYMSDTNVSSASTAFVLNARLTGEFLQIHDLGSVAYGTSVRSVIPTPDGGMMAGGVRAVNGRSMYLVKADPAGNVLWRQEYPQYMAPFTQNTIRSLLPTDNGGAYVLATVEYSPWQTSDLLLMEVDSLGGIVWEARHNFSGRVEIAVEFVRTQDGGFAVAYHSQDAAVNAEGGYVLKLHGDGTYWWRSGKLANLCGLSSIKETPDGDLVVSGCTAADIGERSDMYMAKLGGNYGNLLWARTYGGDWNDYGYDITLAPDGGYAVCGRYDPTSPPTAYTCWATFTS